MKRGMLMLTAGALLLVPIDADAQRARSRDDGRIQNRNGRVERLEPVRAPSRVVDRRVRYVPTRHVRNGRSRVVYSSYGRYGPRWRNAFWVRADWGRRIRFHAIGHRNPNRVLNQARLRDVLGNRTVRRLEDAGRAMGLRGALRGHWVSGYGRGHILVISMDRVDIAEVIDFDRDGFVDDVFLIRGTRDDQVVSRW